MHVIDHDGLGATSRFERAFVPTPPDMRPEAFCPGREDFSAGEPAAADAIKGSVLSSLINVGGDPVIPAPPASLSVVEPAMGPRAAGTSGTEVRQAPMVQEAAVIGAGASVKGQGAAEFRFGVRMEMATTPQGLELAMELPGVQERDIEIEVCGDVLMVRGELRRDSERPDRTYRMSDRSYGKFSRSIDLPKGVRPEQIKASLDCGLLSIFIPNPVSPTATKIHIQSALTYLATVDEVLEFAIAAPGVGEDELDVEIVGGMLTIWGRPKRPIFGDETAPALHGPALKGKEPTIFRSIELPIDVRADQITATLARGVLKVTIPNRSSQNPQRIRVQAG